MDLRTALFIVDYIVVASLLLLVVASLIKQGYKNVINRHFAIFSISYVVFILLNDLCNNLSISSDIALFAMYGVYLSGFASMIFLAQFVVKISGINSLSVLIKKFQLPLWIICITGATPLVVSDIFIQSNAYVEEYGPLIWLFALGILFLISVIFYGLIMGFRRSSGDRKKQLATVGISLLISLPPVIMFSLIFRLITNEFVFSGFGTAPMLILVIGMYYGVVRYHMFDIRLAVVRTLAYILSLVFLVGLYYALVDVISRLFFGGDFGINQNLLNITLVLALLFIFQPVKNFFDRLTNKIFYRGYYNSDELFVRLNRIQTSNVDIRTLLERVANEIALTLKAEQTFFFINTRDNHYVTAGTNHHNQFSKYDVSLIQQEYGNSNEVIIASMIDEKDAIHKLMVRHKIELILPIVQGKTIGYLCLGEHRTSHYTNRDIKVLGTITDGLAIAIQNTLSINEIKDINASNLQRHIDDATKDLRTKNELLRQLDEEKDEFVSVASHELRTPMTVIRGFIGMLKSEQLGDLNEQQQDILDKMSLNTKTLIDLVNEMLDLSKLESDKLDIKLSNNPIDDLIKQSIEKISLLYEAKGVAIKYRGVDAQIKTDPTKFDRVLMNLLSNAYKFTPSGGSVTISSVLDKAKKNVTICVADTGVGIPPESIDLLFKKFSQVDNYLQRQAGGSGLGLAICRQLVEKLGGKIWVESQPGSGSQFYFTMPMAGGNI